MTVLLAFTLAGACRAQSNGSMEGLANWQKINTAFRELLGQVQAFYDQGNLDSVAHLYEAQCLLMIIGPRGLIQTADGGLAIIGTTTVASRFARIVLVKLSATDLANLANQCQALGLCD